MVTGEGGTGLLSKKATDWTCGQTAGPYCRWKDVGVPVKSLAVVKFVRENGALRPPEARGKS